MHTLLGVRTDFSIGDSLINVDELAQAAVDLKQSVVAICDTMNVSSMIDGTKRLAKKNVRLISGVRLRIVHEAVREKKGVATAYIKLFPVNEEGMRAIYKLLSRAFDDDRFYHVPRLVWSDLYELPDDALIITTGDAESALQTESMRDALLELVSQVRFTARFYELVPCSTPYYSRHNKIAVEWGAANDFAPLVISPSAWLDRTKSAYSTNASIALNMPFEDYLRPASDYAPKDLKTLATAVVEARDAVENRYNLKIGPQLKEGLENTRTFADLAVYQWTKLDPCLPSIAHNPDAELVRMCKEGVVQRFGDEFFGYKPSKQDIAAKYIPRLNEELAVLKRLGFAQYFLLVADLVRWAKGEGIYVGPGRGSVGGSLVAFLVGITDVDPIRFELLFERFINPDRLDLPDADLDFMSTRREEVVQYLRTKWGDENVAGIVNYNTMGAKSALRDVMRILKAPADLFGVTKYIPELHGQQYTLEQSLDVPEIADFAKKYPGIWSQALAVEGKMRAFGTHAAGVVVAGEPLTNRAVVEKRGSQRVINWDKGASEEQGLIKLDVLGLSTLDMFDMATRLIFKRHSHKIDINKIPLDDAATLDLFNKAETAGIFQFEGGSVRRLLKDMAASAPVTFDDLVALNALNRPGPLDAGLTESYIRRRAGVESVDYPHPVLEPILEATYGVLCYQEQIMQTTRVLSGFSAGDADGVRKAIGKKDAAKMAEYKDRFVNGAIQLSGMPQIDAEQLWSDIEGFAAYSFNKSHAVEYSLISYQAAYIKARYKVEFYAASMGIASSDKLPAIVKEARSEGMTIIPPDINISTTIFEPLNDTIIAAPLSAVKNVSTKGAEAIMQARKTPTVVEETSGRGSKKITTEKTYGPGPFKSMEEFKVRVPGRLVNSRAIEHLDRVGAFARIEPGQKKSTDPSRQKDQIELMPDIANHGVVADRNISITKVDREFLENFVEEMEAELEIKTTPLEYGRDPKFMVVLDAPFDDIRGQWDAYSFKEFINPALTDAGLCYDDAVWSWISRRPKMKGEREIDADEMAYYLPFFQKELAFVKPPVIVTLGNAVNKFFFPGMKKYGEHIGECHYSAAMGCTVIIGFAPGQIYFSPEKRETLANVFSEAKKLID